MIDTSTVDSIICSVKNVVHIVHEANLDSPVVNFVRPIEIRLVTSHAQQSSRELGGGTVGDGILAVEAGILRMELPLQPAAARRRVP